MVIPKFLVIQVLWSNSQRPNGTPQPCNQVFGKLFSAMKEIAIPMEGTISEIKSVLQENNSATSRRSQPDKNILFSLLLESSGANNSGCDTLGEVNNR